MQHGALILMSVEPRQYGCGCCAGQGQEDKVGTMEAGVVNKEGRVVAIPEHESGQRRGGWRSEGCADESPGL